jgi:hypothetical protein
MSVPKIIYLDQNAWSNLAKDDKAIALLQGMVNSAGAIFPLSIVHLQETLKFPNESKRLELARLMVNLSNGYCLLPYVDKVIAVETRHEILSLYGVQTPSVLNFVLGRGICHLLGVKPSIAPRPGSKVSGEPPPEIRKKMMDYIESPQAILDGFTLLSSHDKKTERSYEAAVAEMEENRKRLQKIVNKNDRKEFVLTDFMINVVGPYVAITLQKLNPPKALVFFKDWGKQEFENFIYRIPTALSLFNLVVKRDQQLSRPIQTNDIPDVWALSLAIPYCDIVVTEKLWASITMNETNLAKRCNTTVIRNITELQRILATGK